MRRLPWAGDEGRAFFRRSVHIRRHKLTVPMQLLRPVRVVVDVYNNLLSFFEAKQRSGKLTVVCGRGDDAIGSEFDRFDGDGEFVVGGAIALGTATLRV